MSASTIASNTAAIDGGGLRADSATIQNSTLSMNVAPQGAALTLVGASASLVEYSTLKDNIGASEIISSVGTTVVRNSIVFGGSGLACAAGGSYSQGGTVNFIKDSSCGGAPFSIADPSLGPLADNGGPTPTQALLAGSLAIDAGGVCAVASDQRGLPRTTPCDVGAYEFGNKPTLTSLIPSSSAQGSGGFTLTVNGSGFISGTVALWNGALRPTSVLSTTQLSVLIPSGDVAAAGTAQVTARYGNAADASRTRCRSPSKGRRRPARPARRARRRPP